MIKHNIYSQAGSSHKSEDVIAFRLHPKDSSVLICSLADGQGGQPGGAIAAKVAVESSLELLSQTSLTQFSNMETWTKIFSLADQNVLENPDAGYTTLVNLCIIGGYVYGASSGDSAAIVFNDKQHYILTQNQYKNPPIGSGQAIETYFASSLLLPWKIIVMSDGVWKYAGWNAVIKASLNGQGINLIKLLYNSVLDSNSGYLVDDFSIAIFEEY